MCYNRNIFLGTEDKVMEKSKVYFTDFRTRLGEGLPSKLKRLMKAAGIQDMDMDHKFVAIKMHFGELGNLGYLRPNYAKAVADVVKELGGIPFLTDCNTLYPGSRKNAIEHMYCAWENGFTPLTVGCPVIIGDGLKGTDDIEGPVEGGEYVKNAKTGRAIMDADVFISLNHFKGHETAGFGGAIKNIGMGCGSRAGKMEQHAQGKPEINENLCRGCKRCMRECAVWQSMRRRSWTADRTSIFLWWWMCLRTVTATGRMMYPSCPISVCSPPSILWRWIRPVWMPA